MRRTLELEIAIRRLFAGADELNPVTEDIVKCLNLEALSQTIRHHEELVYVYRADTCADSGCNYRGELLFPIPATLLLSMPYVRATAEGGISFERRSELWILKDMTLAVVSSARIRLCEGEFESDYRSLKATDPDLFPPGDQSGPGSACHAARGHVRRISGFAHAHL